MRTIIGKLSPTRSPALAIVLFVAGPVLSAYIPLMSFRHSYLSHSLARTVSSLGTHMTILVAGVLYGMAPGFRGSTTRLSVSLPRAVLVTFWISYWLWFMPSDARRSGWWEWLDLQLLDWGARAALAATLVALALLLFRAISRPSLEERTRRSRAPALYRTMAWATVLLAASARGVDQSYFRGVHAWEAIHLLAMAIFFLAYALDARWCRNQRLAAQNEPATSAEKEQAPATQ